LMGKKKKKKGGAKKGKKGKKSKWLYITIFMNLINFLIYFKLCFYNQKY
jgi:hypothetical protein